MRVRAPPASQLHCSAAGASAHVAARAVPCRAASIIEPMPPIDELIRIEPIYLGRLERQGIFTTGLLLEVTETPTRRQNLADQSLLHGVRLPPCTRATFVARYKCSSKVEGRC